MAVLAMRLPHTGIGLLDSASMRRDDTRAATGEDDLVTKGSSIADASRSSEYRRGDGGT